MPLRMQVAVCKHAAEFWRAQTQPVPDEVNHMKKSLTAAALFVIAGAIGVQAQASSSSRIPIRKDAPTTTSTSNGTVGAATTTPSNMMADTTNWAWGWYTPTTSSNCGSVDMSAAHAV